MKKVIYVPTMHSSLAPRGLPEDLLFVCPGLPGSESAFVPQGLPFGPREASAVLAETLALGAAFDSGGDLRLRAGLGWLEREEKRKEEMRAENAALEEFARSGEAPDGNEWTRAAAGFDLAGPGRDDQFKNAQKALLLAWEHERNILAVRELEGKIAAGERRLAAALGEGAAPAGDGPAPNPPPVRPEYSWRIVLDALSAFLPDGAALFTAFGPMIEDLRGQGMLEPLPENLGEALTGWPDELVSGLLTAELPMWRLLGYAALPADRPWLGAARTMFAAPRLEG